MDRRAFLLFGAAGASACVSSWFPPIEPSGDVVGRTSDASGLLSLGELGDREVPYFDPETTTVTGNGDDSFDFVSTGGFTMLLGEHDGDGEFTVSVGGSVFSAGTSGDLVVGYPLTATTHTVSVTASDEWELTLAQPTAPSEEVREPPARAVGTGDVIVGPVDTSEQLLVQADHEGDGEFRVSLSLEASPGLFDPEILFETTGSLEAEATTALSGTAWVAVTASGRWTLRFETDL